MIRRAILLAALLGSCLCSARAQRSSKERIEALAKLPDWSGLWEFDVYVGETLGQSLSPDGLHKANAYAAALRPAFTPAWQPKYDQAKKAYEQYVAADPDHPGAGLSPCAVTPFPATMGPGFFQWRLSPEEATLISSQNNTVRHVYTDGRPHPSADELWPTSEGNSIGHWEGDTLVIDTISIRNPRISIFAEPYQFAFSTGLLSNSLHAVERVRMVNHDEIQIQLTADDPIALAKPLHVTITHERVKGFDRMEDTRDSDCDVVTDRNPVVNGRFTTIVNPASSTPVEPSK